MEYLRVPIQTCIEISRLNVFGNKTGRCSTTFSDFWMPPKQQQRRNISVSLEHVSREKAGHMQRLFDSDSSFSSFVRRKHPNVIMFVFEAVWFIKSISVAWSVP